MEKEIITRLFNKVLNSGIKELHFEVNVGQTVCISIFVPNKKRLYEYSINNNLYEAADIYPFYEEDRRIKNLIELEIKLDNYLKNN